MGMGDLSNGEKHCSHTEEDYNDRDYSLTRGDHKGTIAKEQEIIAKCIGIRAGDYSNCSRTIKFT